MWQHSVEERTIESRRKRSKKAKRAAKKEDLGDGTSLSPSEYTVWRIGTFRAPRVDTSGDGESITRLMANKEVSKDYVSTLVNSKKFHPTVYAAIMRVGELAGTYSHDQRRVAFSFVHEITQTRQSFFEQRNKKHKNKDAKAPSPIVAYYRKYGMVRMKDYARNIFHDDMIPPYEVKSYDAYRRCADGFMSKQRAIAGTHKWKIDAAREFFKHNYKGDKGKRVTSFNGLNSRLTKYLAGQLTVAELDKDKTHSKEDWFTVLDMWKEPKLVIPNNFQKGPYTPAVFDVREGDTSEPLEPKAPKRLGGRRLPGREMILRGRPALSGKTWEATPRVQAYLELPRRKPKPSIGKIPKFKEIPFGRRVGVKKPLPFTSEDKPRSEWWVRNKAALRGMGKLDVPGWLRKERRHRPTKGPDDELNGSHGTPRDTAFIQMNFHYVRDELPGSRILLRDPDGDFEAMVLTHSAAYSLLETDDGLTTVLGTALCVHLEDPSVDFHAYLEFVYGGVPQLVTDDQDHENILLGGDIEENPGPPKRGRGAHRAPVAHPGAVAAAVVAAMAPAPAPVAPAPVAPPPPPPWNHHVRLNQSLLPRTLRTFVTAMNIDQTLPIRFIPQQVFALSAFEHGGLTIADYYQYQIFLKRMRVHAGISLSCALFHAAHAIHGSVGFNKAIDFVGRKTLCLLSKGASCARTAAEFISPPKKDALTALKSTFMWVVNQTSNLARMIECLRQFTVGTIVRLSNMFHGKKPQTVTIKPETLALRPLVKNVQWTGLVILVSGYFLYRSCAPGAIRHARLMWRAWSLRPQGRLTNNLTIDEMESVNNGYIVWQIEDSPSTSNVGLTSDVRDPDTQQADVKLLSVPDWRDVRVFRTECFPEQQTYTTTLEAAGVVDANRIHLSKTSVNIDAKASTDIVVQRSLRLTSHNTPATSFASDAPMRWLVRGISQEQVSANHSAFSGNA